MQTLLGMDMAVIEDYYHMTIMDENMNWMKLTYLLSNFTLNPTTSFAHLRLFQNLKNLFLNIHSREKKKKKSLPYI
jgi:hypothetical protein